MKLFIAALLSGLMISSMCAAKDNQPAKSWNGTNAGISEHKQVVIRDAKAWQKLWAQVHSNIEPKPPVPEVDFSTHMVVGYFLGQKSTGGHSVTIESIEEKEGKTVVTIAVTAPGRGSIVSQVITSPYALKATEKSDKEVVFKSNVGVITKPGR